jgi:hypothetical protein
MFAEYDIVKVVNLNDFNRPYSGSKNISRPPQVGNAGTIVHVLEANKAFIIEMVGANGSTVWLADFEADELERA